MTRAGQGLYCIRCRTRLADSTAEEGAELESSFCGLKQTLPPKREWLKGHELSECERSDAGWAHFVGSLAFVLGAISPMLLVGLLPPRAEHFLDLAFPAFFVLPAPLAAAAFRVSVRKRSRFVRSHAGRALRFQTVFSLAFAAVSGFIVFRYSACEGSLYLLLILAVALPANILLAAGGYFAARQGRSI